ncbi:FAD-binding domain-containing protein [Pseudovirgaria hyperparasitica]|uniref:FAD-binding domain-containing protein n=1 Tax=Pseudovirgaria hyperparasitica TaxID=470096 RepID=A0A6A6W0U9_9PEZI|nr:FAD-binding domain-containing protein [Pseudovirgaria hyperparasitica]KAF2756538.1 FAD-binding domain-containing protein [Pseudovirgaria hyperparasitica]
MNCSRLTSTLLVSAFVCAISVFASDSACLKKCLDTTETPSYFSDSPQWASLIEPFNLRLNYTPAAVVTADNPEHVSHGVLCARNCHIKVQAKSGGHSYASFSSGGQNGSLVIDLASLNTVTVNQADGTAIIEGGVRLGNVDDMLYAQGKRAMSHGTCSNIGIGGHITHGGYGYDSRLWGLALDHLIAMEVVLADGSISTVSPTENEDVYWALRGAADSIGIVTKFHVRTQLAPEKLVYWVYDLTDILIDVPTSVASLQEIQDFALNPEFQDRRSTWGWFLGPSTFLLRGKFFGTLDEWNNRIAPELLKGLPPPRTGSGAATDVREVSWLESQALFYGFEDINSLQQPEEPGQYNTHDIFYAKSLTIPDPMTEAAMTDYFTYAATQGATVAAPSSWFSIVNLYGGPDSQINIYDAEWSSYKDRDSIWVVQNYASVAAGNVFNEGLRPFLDNFNDAMTESMPETAFGAYANYIDPDLTAEEAHFLYYGEDIYPRLLDIKMRVDPDQVFYNPLAVGVGDF